MDGKLMNKWEGFVQKYETICRDIWLGKILKNGWKVVYNKLIGFFFRITTFFKKMVNICINKSITFQIYNLHTHKVSYVNEMSCSHYLCML